MEEVNYQCEICGKIYSTKSACVKHELKCAEKEEDIEWACDNCDKVFESKKEVLVHEKKCLKKKDKINHDEVGNDIKQWGWILIIWGVISFVFSGTFDIIWGGLTLVIGFLILFFKKIQVYILLGFALFLVGLSNLFLGYDGGLWSIIGVLQIYWGFKEISKYLKLRKHFTKHNTIINWVVITVILLILFAYSFISFSMSFNAPNEIPVNVEFSCQRFCKGVYGASSYVVAYDYFQDYKCECFSHSGERLSSTNIGN